MLKLGLILGWILAGSLFSATTSGHYLLMEPIQTAMMKSDISLLKSKSQHRISVNLEPPLELNGYLYFDKFTENFSQKLSEFDTQKIEWSSRQLEEKYSVQSLNLTLKNKRTEKYIHYKFIFFLTKVKQEWKIYYLKGLTI